MDPNACLLLILSRMREGDKAHETTRDDIVDGLRDLATWIEKGGFLPTVQRMDDVCAAIRHNTTGRNAL